MTASAASAGHLVRAVNEGLAGTCDKDRWRCDKNDGRDGNESPRVEIWPGALGSQMQPCARERMLALVAGCYNYLRYMNIDHALVLTGTSTYVITNQPRMSGLPHKTKNQIQIYTPSGAPNTYPTPAAGPSVRLLAAS